MSKDTAAPRPAEASIDRRDTAKTLLSAIEPTVVRDVVDREPMESLSPPAASSSGGSMLQSIAVTTNTSRSNTFSCKSTSDWVKVFAALSPNPTDITIIPDVSFKPLGMYTGHTIPVINIRTHTRTRPS